MAADRHAMPAFSVGDRREAVFALRLLDAGRQWLGKCAQRLSPLTEVLRGFFRRAGQPVVVGVWVQDHDHALFVRSEEHTSELQSLMRISYAVFCLKKKKTK